MNQSLGLAQEEMRDFRLIGQAAYGRNGSPKAHSGKPVVLLRHTSETMLDPDVHCSKTPPEGKRPFRHCGIKSFGLSDEQRRS
jgi:hypothetical protein